MVEVHESMQGTPGEVSRPPGFLSVENILEMPMSTLLREQSLVNIIALIKDYQPPVPTRKTDYKCALGIVDCETQDDNGIKVHIFMPHDDMPHISGVSDVVILRRFRTQTYNGSPSLINTFSSSISVFHAAQIPSWPCRAPKTTLKPAFTHKAGTPSFAEANYVMWLASKIDKTELPDVQTFQERTFQATTIKDKYSTLKDVKAGHFYDMIGEVIKLFENGDRGTMYISDYTANSLFYNNEWTRGRLSPSHERDGDEYGYVKSGPKSASDWPGPFGKLSIQLTVYEPHLSFIREHVKVHDWVLLQNVNVKMGKMGGCLEGFLHGDREREGRIQVQIMRRPDDPELIDPRWKETVRRKKAWWERHEAQKKAFQEEGEDSSGKRKLDNQASSKQNGKKRRKEAIDIVVEKVAAIEQKIIGKTDLNKNVKSYYPNRVTTSLKDVLKKSTVIKPETETRFTLPFQNINYKANVRVIDYWPHKLEDFSVGRRVSDYDMLSDVSCSESTDVEEDVRQFRNGKGYGGEKVWEWRFALHVEEAVREADSCSETVWLLVDNMAAQFLLKKDAVNLRQDDSALTELRETLFKLWGDLEEKKSAFLLTPLGKALQNDSILASVDSVKLPDRIPHKVGEDLPPDSDDEDASNHRPPNRVSANSRALAERSPNIGSMKENDPARKDHGELSAAISALPFVNKGFACCIKQYGVKVAETNPSKADAGEELRWQRMFGLYGTTID